MSLSEPTRNLALEIVRVTEAAALASGRWMEGAKRKRLTMQRWKQCA